MGVIPYLHFSTTLFLMPLQLSWSIEDVFLTSPGNGSDFVYSPVNVDATIHCAVNSATISWGIDQNIVFDEIGRVILRQRGIRQYRGNTTLEGVTASTVIIPGNNEINNQTHVCCRTLVMSDNLSMQVMMCATLILYDRPSPPGALSLQHLGGNVVNISWTSSTQIAVEQSYIIVLESNMSETAESYYVYQLSRLATSCGVFLAHVKAVNGAGESDPSNNVTIPSLPDIEPVTASLTHQVWKSNGHIMVNVSFEPAGYCKEYPTVSYMLTVTSQQSGQPLMTMSLAASETKVVLGNLEGDQKYLYAVTATNEIGTTNASGEQRLITTDVQAVTATMRGSVIELQCHFIPGSNAMGCQITLKSNCTGVDDLEDIHISREGTTATRQLSVLSNISCYRQVVAYTIDINNTVSNLSIEGIVQPTVDNTQRDGAQNQVIAIVVPTVSVLLIVAVILMVTISFIIRRRTKRTTVCSECSKNIPPDKESPAKESPTTQDKKTVEQDPPPTYAAVNPAECSTIKQNDAYNITSVIQAESMPIYALPDKLKHKNTIEQPVSESDTKEKEEGSYDQLNEHVYHVLEGGQAPKVHTADPQTYESPKKSLKVSPDVSNSASSPGPVYQDVLSLPAKKEKTKSSTHQEQTPDKNTTCGDTAAAPSPGPVYQEVLKISAKKKTESSTHQPVQNTTSGETAAAKMDEAENKGSNVSDQPSTSEQKNT